MECPDDKKKFRQLIEDNRTLQTILKGLKVLYKK